ncbi:hypothetical protein AB0F81_01175 [Actinoplanes sp. NPDC024001]|uniref:hypothetical protein n=1 Tax=unclassified Actinoplanes TaxID=2626549 RepID=UPI002E1EF4CC
MEALLVVVLLLLFIRSADLVAQFLALRQPGPAGPPASSGDPCSSAGLVRSPATALDLERVLLDRLLSGDIGQEEYRAAMADAARLR